MVRSSRLSAPVHSAPRSARWFLLAGLAFAGIGCTGETPSDAPVKPESEKGVVEKVEDKAIEVGKKVEDGVGTAAKATGEAIVKAGVKLETDAADSVKKNVGETAGGVVESVGKGMEKAGASVDKGGEKLKEAAKP